MRRPSWRMWLGMGGLALALALAVRLIVRAWPFTTDDAYITLRYARSLAEGRGLTFNAGEAPLEGYSNFLFVLLGASALRLGVDPIAWLKLAGCAGQLVTLVLIYALARRTLGPAGAAVAPLGFVALYGSTLWAVSGLETAVYEALVLGAVLAYLKGVGWGPSECPRTGATPSAAWWALAGALALLASLTRPEGPLVFAVLAVAAAIDLGSRWRSRAPVPLRPHVALLASFALPYIAYTLGRWWTFGSLLPNSVLCKAHWQGDPWALHRELLAEAWPLLALAAIAVVRRGQPDVRRAIPVACLALYVTILFGADPIVGRSERHFLAALALLAPLSAEGLVRLVGLPLRFLSADGREVAALAIRVAGVLALLARLSGRLDIEAKGYALRMETRAALADWLGGRLAPGDAYVVGDAGLVPYRAGGRALDALCLNSREMTHPPIDFSAERWADWALAQAPHFVLIPSHDAQHFHPQFLESYPTLTWLVRNPRFRARYRVAAVFATPGDSFNYFVFERFANDGGAPR